MSRKKTQKNQKQSQTDPLYLFIYNGDEIVIKPLHTVFIHFLDGCEKFLIPFKIVPVSPTSTDQGLFPDENKGGDMTIFFDVYRHCSADEKGVLKFIGNQKMSLMSILENEDFIKSRDTARGIFSQFRVC